MSGIRSKKAARVIAVLAVAVPTSLAGLALPAPAGAATARVKCSYLKTNTKQPVSTGVVQKCTNPKATGGSGKIQVNAGKQTGKVTWNKTGTSTFSIKTTVPKAGTPAAKGCPAGSTKLLFNGKITGGTGAALKAMPKGQAMSAKVCLSKAGVVTLQPKTFITL
jgi:hypothetical protein